MDRGYSPWGHRELDTTERLTRTSVLWRCLCPCVETCVFRRNTKATYNALSYLRREGSGDRLNALSYSRRGGSGDRLTLTVSPHLLTMRDHNAAPGPESTRGRNESTTQWRRPGSLQLQTLKSLVSCVIRVKRETAARKPPRTGGRHTAAIRNLHLPPRCQGGLGGVWGPGLETLFPGPGAHSPLQQLSPGSALCPAPLPLWGAGWRLSSEGQVGITSTPALLSQHPAGQRAGNEQDAAQPSPGHPG